MNIPLHSIIESSDTLMFSGAHRLLGFDRHGDAVLIRLKPAHSAPFLVDFEVLSKEIELKRAIVTAEETRPGQPLRREDLSQSGRVKLDECVKMVRTVVPDLETDQSWMAPEILQIQIRHVSRTWSLPKLKAQRLVYRWLAGGRRDIALAHQNSAAAGGKRSQQENGEKRGRKMGAAQSELVKKVYSLPVTKDIAAKLERAIGEFYNANLRNFTEAYDSTINAYFTRESKGRKTLQPQLPTKRQFRYAINRLNGGKHKLLRKAVGERHFARNHRGLAGRESDRSEGASFVFQFDATNPRVHIVSEWDRTTKIGIPTSYFTIDESTTLIVGEYATHLTADLNTARAALFYTFMDKKQIWRHANVPLKKGEFEKSYICHRLITDRGEMRSADADNLVRDLGIILETKQAGRPDLKGLVELCNSLIELEAIKMCPGYRSDLVDEECWPSVTMSEYRIIQKRAVLKLNLRPAKRPPVDPKISNMEGFTIFSAYDWGVRNTRGAGKTMPADQLYLALLPTVPCTLSRAGLVHEGQVFSSRELANTALTAVGASNKQQLSQMMIDLDDVSRGWFRVPQSNEVIELQNLDKRVREARASLEDAKALMARDKSLGAATVVQQQLRRSELSGQNRKLGAEASTKAKQARKVLGKKGKSRKADSVRVAQEKAFERANNIAHRQAAAGIAPPEVAIQARQRASATQTAIENQRAEVTKLLDDLF